MERPEPSERCACQNLPIVTCPRKRARERAAGPQRGIRALLVWSRAPRVAGPLPITTHFRSARSRSYADAPEADFVRGVRALARNPVSSIQRACRPGIARRGQRPPPGAATARGPLEGEMVSRRHSDGEQVLLVPHSNVPNALEAADVNGTSDNGRPVAVRKGFGLSRPIAKGQSRRPALPPSPEERSRLSRSRRRISVRPSRSASELPARGGGGRWCPSSTPPFHHVGWSWPIDAVTIRRRATRKAIRTQKFG